MKLLAIVILFFLNSFLILAQVKNDEVAIYIATDTISIWGKDFPNEIRLSYCKIDFTNKTIQFLSFSPRLVNDPTPDLHNLKELFVGKSKDYFKVINKNKIKVARVKATKVNRAWNNFATPRKSGGEPSKVYCLEDETVKLKKGKLIYYLDKQRTKEFLNSN